MTVKKDRKRSQLAEVWRRLKMNKSAMIGLTVILILLISALFAPFIAPYNPVKTNVRDRLQ